jgi:hypothetical protein
VLLDAMDVLTTWPAWDHLRRAGKSPQEVRAVMATGLTALLSNIAGPSSLTAVGQLAPAAP